MNTSDVLLDVIREIEDRSGASLFVECSRCDVDAPFVIERGSRAAVEKAARTLGYALREQEGFLHLHARQARA